MHSDAVVGQLSHVPYTVQFTLTDTVVQTPDTFHDTLISILLRDTCVYTHQYICVTLIPCGFTAVQYTARQVYDDRKTTQLASVHGHHLAFGLVCFAMQVILRAGRRQREL